MQDGLDLIEAVARHPDDRPAARAEAVRLLRQRSRSARRGADRRAWRGCTTAHRLRDCARWSRRCCCRRSSGIQSNYYKRYSWPVEFVVALDQGSRAGAASRVNSALTPLVNMGQQLFEPPDVNGWELGPRLVLERGMLARMNFAAVLATNQRFNLRDQSRRPGRFAGEPAVVHARSPDAARVRARRATTRSLDYADAGGAWTGSRYAARREVVRPGAPDYRIRRLPARVS